MLEWIILGLVVVLIILNVILLVLKASQKPDEIKHDDSDLKLYFKDEYANLRVHMVQLFGDANKSSQNDLTQFKDSMMKHIDERMNTINEKVELRLGEGFQKTNTTFQNVIERLTKIDEAQKKIETLSTEVIQLNDLLTDKKSRGTFGEVQLTQILQAVMGDNKQLYELQKTMENGTKVDALIYAPEPLGKIAVDSKFPLENYRRMIDKSTSELERTNAEKEFKRDVKKHIDDIADKYIIPGITADQAFMFIPAEAIFAEITAYHDDIISYSQKRNVWLTSPTTLISTLTTILTIVKNIERDKQTTIIREELRKLGEEFGRYATRWEALKKDIDRVSKDTKDVHNTSIKISRKFDQINDAKFDEALEENDESNDLDD